MVSKEQIKNLSELYITETMNEDFYKTKTHLPNFENIYMQNIEAQKKKRPTRKATERFHKIMTGITGEKSNDASANFECEANSAPTNENNTIQSNESYNKCSLCNKSIMNKCRMGHMIEHRINITLDKVMQNFFFIYVWIMHIPN